MGRRFLYTVQFGRGDVDTHSGKPVYTSELQSKSSCDLAVVFTSLKYMHQRSTWTNFSRRWLSLSDQHWWSTLSFRSSMWLILWCQTSVSYCIGYHLLVLKLGYVRVGKLWPNLALEKKEETFPVSQLICLFKSPIFGFTTVALCEVDTVKGVIAMLAVFFVCEVPWKPSILWNAADTLYAEEIVVVSFFLEP